MTIMSDKDQLGVSGSLSLVLLGTLATLGALQVGVQTYGVTMDDEAVVFTGIMGFLLTSLVTVGYGIYAEAQRFSGPGIKKINWVLLVLPDFEGWSLKDIYGGIHIVADGLTGISSFSSLFLIETLFVLRSFFGRFAGVYIPCFLGV
jgi:hypothetical protein